MAVVVDASGGGRLECPRAFLGICPAADGGVCSEPACRAEQADPELIYELNNELLKAEIQKARANGRIERVRGWGYTAGVGLTIALGIVGLGAAVGSGAGLQYGGGAATGAAGALIFLRYQGARRG